MKKTGKVIRKGKKFSLTEALPSSPIYKRGFVVGGQQTTNSSKDTQAKNSNNENEKRNFSSRSLEEQKKELDKAAKHQMSAEPDLSTGAKKKD
jgi:hypothetical protein